MEDSAIRIITSISSKVIVPVIILIIGAFQARRIKLKQQEIKTRNTLMKTIDEIKCAIKHEDYDRALKLIESSGDTNLLKGDLLYLESKIYRNMNDTDRERKSLLESYVADKGIASVTYRLGDLEFDMGNYQEAIKFYEYSIVDIPKSDAKIHNKVGHSYAKLKNYKLAIKSYEKAFNLDSHSDESNKYMRNIRELEHLI